MAKPKPTKMLAILGRCRRTGRWRVAARSSVLAVLGSCRLDMRASFVDEGQDQMKMKVTVVLGSAVLVLPDGAEVRPSGVSLLAGSLVDVPEHDEHSGLPMLDIEWTCVLGRLQIVTGPALDELKAAAAAAREAKRARHKQGRKGSKKAPSKPILVELAEREQARPPADRPDQALPLEPVAMTVGPAEPGSGALIGGPAPVGPSVPPPEPPIGDGDDDMTSGDPASIGIWVGEPEVVEPEVVEPEVVEPEVVEPEVVEPEVATAWASHDWGDDQTMDAGSDGGDDLVETSPVAADDLDEVDLGDAWRSHDWGEGLDGEGGSASAADDVGGVDLGDAWRSHDWGDGLDGDGGSYAATGEIPIGDDDEEVLAPSGDETELPAEVAEAWRSHDWGDGASGGSGGIDSADDGAGESNPGRRATDQTSTSRSGT